MPSIEFMLQQRLLLVLLFVVQKLHLLTLLVSTPWPPALKLQLKSQLQAQLVWALPPRQ